MNRRGALVKFMSLLCVAAFLGAAVLSCGGGGGGGGGLGPVTFSSPDQAAAMGSTGIATMAVAQDTAVSAITFGTANIPAFGRSRTPTRLPHSIPG